MEMTEERLNRFEDRRIGLETFQSKGQIENQLHKLEQSLRDLWDIQENWYLHYGSPRRREGRCSEGKKSVLKNNGRIFPNIGEIHKPTDSRIWGTPKSINLNKSTARHIIIKFVEFFKEKKSFESIQKDMKHLLIYL